MSNPQLNQFDLFKIDIYEKRGLPQLTDHLYFSKKDHGIQNIALNKHYNRFLMNKEQSPLQDDLKMIKSSEMLDYQRSLLQSQASISYSKSLRCANSNENFVESFKLDKKVKKLFLPKSQKPPEIQKTQQQWIVNDNDSVWIQQQPDIELKFAQKQVKTQKKIQQQMERIQTQKTSRKPFYQMIGSCATRSNLSTAKQLFPLQQQTYSQSSKQDRNAIELIRPTIFQEYDLELQSVQTIAQKQVSCQSQKYNEDNQSSLLKQNYKEEQQAILDHQVTTVHISTNTTEQTPLPNMVKLKNAKIFFETRSQGERNLDDKFRFTKNNFKRLFTFVQQKPKFKV